MLGGHAVKSSVGARRTLLPIGWLPTRGTRTGETRAFSRSSEDRTSTASSPTSLLA
ncbi:hypothetical protein DPMN_145602 [Dreissena polymorpha]|uniref:Uncharacterized protein n=1 Tax=Dreissena polymorpha TaxID=45954 RepID=A0A9D4J1I0_DREPO|nr:hypothetical protein DPMN_145602 [Dreissena polymorpha]